MTYMHLSKPRQECYFKWTRLVMVNLDPEFNWIENLGEWIYLREFPERVIYWGRAI